MAGKAGGGSGGGGGITCPTVANFDEDWSARVCQKNNDCCMSATPSTCVSDAQAGIIQLYPSLETSITAGQAEFNCADYIACMTAVNAASCNDWPKEASPDFGLPVNEPKCRTFIRGLIPSGNGMNGMACTQSYQCINGHCADPDGTGTQVRQCVAFRGTGLSCEAVPAAGEANLVCNPVIGWCDQPDTNVAGVCRARGVNGATCANGDQCESRICSTTCQAAAPAACPWIPQPVTCSVSNVGAQKGSLSWLALAGFIGLGAMGRRRRRR
jgi:hypothetical protein